MEENLATLAERLPAPCLGNTVYMSGQIPLDPKTMELVEGFEAQTVQVFENLKSVAEAAGGSFKDIVKLNIFLTD
ncbi:Rid family hydrolase, partial [Klebsiella variicola]|uniref:Rid family hydrolase n=1 Tax=Klebsiella variicola TaxID=244366 RepID=UPI0039C0B026